MTNLTDDWICGNCKFWEKTDLNDYGNCKEVGRKKSRMKVSKNNKLFTQYVFYCGDFEPVKT